MYVYIQPLPDGLRYTDGIKIVSRGPGLLPVGPKYCAPPNTKSWFMTKVAARAGIQFLGAGKEWDPSVVVIYDRSLKLDGILCGAKQIYNLVWMHGSLGQLYSDWKKLFIWTKGPEDGKLRVFIKEFPPYQNW